MNEKRLDTEERAETVMIVDDEDDIRSLLSDAVERWGYAPIEARNGREALAKLEEAPVDMMLTDLRMPELDGLGLLKEARAASPDTQVILFTGYGTVDSAVDALKHGASDYLQKPVDLAELRTKIGKAIEQHRAIGSFSVLSSLNWALLLSVPVWLILGIILVRSLG